jgi:hypothetical protein
MTAILDTDAASVVAVSGHLRMAGNGDPGARPGRLAGVMNATTTERYDGLRVTPGPLPGCPRVLSSPFQPTAAYAVEGLVRPAAVGWTSGSGRRSLRTASAMIAEDGSVVASAGAVWVALRHQWAVRAISRIAG